MGRDRPRFPRHGRLPAIQVRSLYGDWGHHTDLRTAQLRVVSPKFRLKSRFGGLPAAAEGVVQLDQSEELVELGLSETELGGKGPGAAVQDFEIARCSSAIPLLGQR